MKKCKSCKAEIPNDAKKCSHCATDQRNWFARHKILTGILILVLIGMISSAGGGTNSSNTSLSQASTPTVSEVTETPIQPTASIKEQAQEPTKIPVKNVNTTAPIQNAQTAPVSSETVSQRNAIRKAKSYLDYSGFSRDGLVAQLEYEKFSHEDAIYGADNSGGNWNEEAAQKAKSYIEYSSFSRDGLIEQLKYEKFTQEQAEYGAKAVGL